MEKLNTNTMKKTILKKSYYGQSTSLYLKMVGDFLNYASAAGAVSVISNGVTEESKWWAIGFVMAGALGKAITNAFTTVNVEESKNEE